MNWLSLSSSKCDIMPGSMIAHSAEVSSQRIYVLTPNMLKVIRSSFIVAVVIYRLEDVNT